ncbi:MAG: 23S rRNA (uracil(1939)-C(5))-methyltransferase RlmD [Candidatus Margulisiibacteriota bacterium]
MPKKKAQIVIPESLKSTSNCVHFPTCGGCQMMDVPYPNQLVFKQAQLSDLFAKTLPDLLPTLKPIIGAEVTQFHRNKMEFSFGQGRKEGDIIDPTQLVLGLKQRGRFDEVVPISDCKLQDPQTNAILAFTQTFFQNRGLPGWSALKRGGVLRQLLLRHAKASDTWLVVVTASEFHEAIFNDYARELQAKFPNVVSVSHALNTGLGDGILGLHPQTLLAGTTHIEEQLGPYRFRISPASFFQTHSKQAEVLYATIANAVTITPNDVVFDLYCGTGTIGLFVADKAKHVYGIEENPAAILNAIENAKQNGIHNVTFKTENVKNFLKFTDLKPDVVIVDPPRDGLIPKALRRLVAAQPQQLVYVSCNPNTLVRDLPEILAGGYRVLSIQPVDMFPHSLHVEVVVGLARV